jgi:hypothetical protein
VAPREKEMRHSAWITPVESAMSIRLATGTCAGTLLENTERNTMPYRKTAIAMPEVLLTDVDRAAAERGESRSAYITRVLSVAVRAKRDAEITRKLDELFASEGLSKAQRRGAAALDALGTEWTDERW